MSETDSPGPFVNPFKLIPTADKASLRPFLASAVVAKLKRPLSAPERLLAAAGAAQPKAWSQAAARCGHYCGGRSGDHGRDQRRRNIQPQHPQRNRERKRSRRRRERHR